VKVKQDNRLDDIDVADVNVPDGIHDNVEKPNKSFG